MNLFRTILKVEVLIVCYYIRTVMKYVLVQFP